MRQVSISEEVLADIASALRETLGTSQPFTLPNFYRGVLSIEAPMDHFTWVIDNDDNSYFYLDVWDE